MTPVIYKTVDEFAGWQSTSPIIEQIIRSFGCRRILEVGSGANPTFPPDYILTTNLHYTVNDISATELGKADPIYRRLCLDVGSDDIPRSLENRYDLIFSRMTNEHVEDGNKYHRNIHAMLVDGGIAAHWFSTLYSLPFVANKLLSAGLCDRLLQLTAPRDSYQHGRFKAYYSWSRGPSTRMIRRFESLGYAVLQFTGYFGHNYYQRLPWLNRFGRVLARFLAQHPVPLLTSYAFLVVRKGLSKSSEIVTQV